MKKEPQKENSVPREAELSPNNNLFMASLDASEERHKESMRKAAKAKKVIS